MRHDIKERHVKCKKKIEFNLLINNNLDFSFNSWLFYFIYWYDNLPLKLCAKFYELFTTCT